MILTRPTTGRVRVSVRSDTINVAGTSLETRIGTGNGTQIGTGHGLRQDTNWDWNMQNLYILRANTSGTESWNIMRNQKRKIRLMNGTTGTGIGGSKRKVCECQ